MKIAFFDPSTGAAVRVFSGQACDADAAQADPRYAGYPVRTLDGTPYAGAMTLLEMPSLEDFDAAAGG